MSWPELHVDDCLSVNKAQHSSATQTHDVFGVVSGNQNPSEHEVDRLLHLSSSSPADDVRTMRNENSHDHHCGNEITPQFRYLSHVCVKTSDLLFSFVRNVVNDIHEEQKEAMKKVISYVVRQYAPWSRNPDYLCTESDVEKRFKIASKSSVLFFLLCRGRDTNYHFLS